MKIQLRKHPWLLGIYLLASALVAHAMAMPLVWLAKAILHQDPRGDQTFYQAGSESLVIALMEHRSLWSLATSLTTWGFVLSYGVAASLLAWLLSALTQTPRMHDARQVSEIDSLVRPMSRARRMGCFAMVFALQLLAVLILAIGFFTIAALLSTAFPSAPLQRVTLLAVVAIPFAIVGFLTLVMRDLVTAMLFEAQISGIAAASSLAWTMLREQGKGLIGQRVLRSAASSVLLGALALLFMRLDHEGGARLLGFFVISEVALAASRAIHVSYYTEIFRRMHPTPTADEAPRSEVAGS